MSASGRSAPLALAFLLALGAPQDPLGEARALLARGECTAALDACLERLAAAPGDGPALDLAGRILRDPRHVASATSERAMAELARHPALTRASLVPEGEPGDPLVVRGVVRDGAGRPLEGARLHVFQTDREGRYTPAKTMDEPHARLFAHVRTAADGRFELATIRPGAYPGTPERTGVEWRIPSHVHFEVEREGCAPRRFQLVFADDPRMQPEHWRAWAREGGHQVATVERDERGVQHAELEIVLEAR